MDYNALMSFKIVELQLQGLVNISMDPYQEDAILQRVAGTSTSLLDPRKALSSPLYLTLAFNQMCVRQWWPILFTLSLQRDSRTGASGS